MGVVLMYHDIVTKDDKSSGFQNDSAFQYKVEESFFEEQVKALQGKDVVFTFDDGGVSFFTKAAPILEKYGFKGVFFISTKHIGTPGFLTTEQVRELERRGHIIGSHSHSHPNNIASLSYKEMDEEWRKSARILKDILGHQISMASIPNGYGSNKLNASALAAGFTELFTSVPTTKVSFQNGQQIIGRYVVHCDMTTDDVIAIVTDIGRRKKMYLRWWGLEQAKKVLGSSYDRVKAIFVK